MNGSSSKKQKRKKTVLMKKCAKAHINLKVSPSRRVHKCEVGGGENPIDMGSERPPRK